MPKVSVIIPTYNRASFLENSVNSVLKQTFKDYEIIISDDASTDNTEEYVKSIKDPRVVYIQNPNNLGAAATRNSAIKSSKGKYIAFLDDDDKWLPNKLSLQVEKLDNSPPDMGCIGSAVSYFDADSQKITFSSKPETTNDILVDILSRNLLVSSSLLLRKSCFDKVGLFDESFPASEDFDMWIRIAKHFKYDFIKQPLVIYTIHDIRITRNREAIMKGLELLLAKHEDMFSKNEKIYSDYKLWLGTYYCFCGNTQKGRTKFIEAIKLYPYNFFHYYNLALSFCGSDIYMKIKIYRSKISKSLKNLTQI